MAYGGMDQDLYNTGEQCSIQILHIIFISFEILIEPYMVSW